MFYVFADIRGKTVHLDLVNNGDWFYHSRTEKNEDNAQSDVITGLKRVWSAWLVKNRVSEISIHEYYLMIFKPQKAPHGLQRDIWL